MLILTRNIIKNEIVIGKHEEISVKILGVQNGSIKIGIAAPSHIPINRREVLDRTIEMKEDELEEE